MGLDPHFPATRRSPGVLLIENQDFVHSVPFYSAPLGSRFLAERLHGARVNGAIWMWLSCGLGLELILSHPPSLGWESAVSVLQNHLWGEDWNAAVGEDGGVQVPHVPPRPRRLWDDPHCLQYPSWHPGEGPGQNRHSSGPLFLPSVLSPPAPSTGSG